MRKPPNKPQKSSLRKRRKPPEKKRSAGTPKESFLAVRLNEKYVKNYEIKENDGWVYGDSLQNVTNYLPGYSSSNPHLVFWERLPNGDKVSRFVIHYKYDSHANAVHIRTIQRERTQYNKVKGTKVSYFWNREKEAKSVKALQKNLGGIFPSEFLFLEFIYRHREQINAGMRVTLDVYEKLSDEDTPTRYKPLGIYKPFARKFFEIVGPIPNREGWVRYIIHKDLKPKSARDEIETIREILQAV